MKKISLGSAMLALVIIIGLTFVSCWTTGSVNQPTQFEGKWLYDPADLESYGLTELSFTFVGDTFVFRHIFDEDNSRDRIISGTFKFRSDQIRFTSEGQNWTQPYSLNGGQLRLRVSSTRRGGFPGAIGLYMKQ